MHQRCNDPNRESYQWYGALGIRVCAAWSSFTKFKNWAEDNGYRRGLTLERIDNSGNYSPRNCKWATRKEQARNRRTSKRITAFGETKVLAAWAEDPRCSVKAVTLGRRIDTGWRAEEAITTPPLRRAT
jgi:hypothetical protein